MSLSVQHKQLNDIFSELNLKSFESQSASTMNYYDVF